MANPFQNGIGAIGGGQAPYANRNTSGKAPYYAPQGGFGNTGQPRPAEPIAGHMLNSYLNYGPQVSSAMQGAQGQHAANQQAAQGTRAQNYNWANSAGKLPFDVASGTGKGQMGDFNNWLWMNRQMAEQDLKMRRNDEAEQARRQREEYDLRAPERERNRQLMLTMLQQGMFGGIGGFGGMGDPRGLGGFSTNFGASGGLAPGYGFGGSYASPVGGA